MILADILFLAIIISLFNRGLHAVTRDGMLLSFAGVRLRTSERLQDLADRRENELTERQFLYNIAYSQCANDAQKRDALTRADEAARQEIYDKYEKLSEAEIERADKLKSYRAVRILLALSPALTECAVCMSSVWSIVVLSLYFAFGAIAFLPFMPLVVAGLTVTLSNSKTHE